MDKSSSVQMSDSLQSQKSDHTILLAAKGGGIVFVGTVFGYGCQLLTGILLTRLLGVVLYGQYKIAVTTGEIAASLALLGLQFAMVRFVSLYASRGDNSGLWGALQVGIGLAVLSSVLIGIGLYALATPLALYVFHEPLLIPLLHLASLIVPFSTLSRVFASATNGFKNMQYATGAQQIAQPLVRLVLILPLALLGLTAGKAMIPYIAGVIVTFVLLVYFLDRLFTLRRPLQTARRDIRGLLRFSLPAYLSTLLDTFGPNLQTILLGSLNTIATVGIFAAATQISTAGSMFNMSIGTASSPIISELHSQGHKEQLAHFYQTTTKWMFSVNLPMFLIVMLFSKSILLIFGKEFVEGSTALTILALANLVIAAVGASDGVLAMTGNTPAKLVNSAVQAVFTIGLCFLFIPRWGAVGAAVAALATATVVNLMRVSEVYLLFRMFPYNLSFLKPAVAGMIALAFGWFTRQMFHTETHLALAAMNAIVILVVYASVLLLLGLSQDDRAVFYHLRKRIAVAISKR